MPNRILKESICTSATVDQLSADEERLFYRLVVQCDDYGRFYAHPGIVRGYCFPRKPGIDVEDVADWLASLDRVGLICVFEVADDQYLQMVTWGKHQQKRASHSKFPDPPADVIARMRLIANDFSSNQKSPYPVSGIENRESLLDTRDPGVESAETEGDDVARVYAHFKRRVMPRSRTFPKDKIAIRLRHFSAEELIRGIDHFADDPWWMENNATRGAEWFFKSDSRSEQFLEMQPRKPRARQNGTHANGAISPEQAAKYLGEDKHPQPVEVEPVEAEPTERESVAF